MTQPPYVMERIGVLMTADPADPLEAWGVLNPASARGRDGDALPVPASRRRRQRVAHRPGAGDLRRDGRPSAVERLGVVLEPERAGRRTHWAAGSRIRGSRSCRASTATSWPTRHTVHSGRAWPWRSRATWSHWERLGPVSFAYDPRLASTSSSIPNKDAMFFPEPVPGPDGEPSYAMLHRPMWDLSWIRDGRGRAAAARADRPAPRDLGLVRARGRRRGGHLGADHACDEHRLVAMPEQPWECAQDRRRDGARPRAGGLDDRCSTAWTGSSSATRPPAEGALRGRGA